ncbi:hypothetical protein Tco_0762037, partial [Tanacetum coccineum]
RWNLRLPLSPAREVSSSSLASVVFAIFTSATDVAATWASGTQSADVAVPRWLTWDPHADVTADVLGLGLDGGSRLGCRNEVPMIGSGSEPIIGLADRSV